MKIIFNSFFDVHLCPPTLEKVPPPLVTCMINALVISAYCRTPHVNFMHCMMISNTTLKIFIQVSWICYGFYRPLLLRGSLL